jgi:hypothetical protein
MPAVAAGIAKAGGGMTMPNIAALIRGFPALRPGGHAERLGGLTNRVYRLGDVVLRMPGRGTEAYIDRANEAVAARAAALAGSAPRCCSPTRPRADGDPLHAGTVTMTPAGFAVPAPAPGPRRTAFARLHASGARFPAGSSCSR